MPDTASDHDWENAKQIIRRLYIEENRKLKDVMEEMRSRHGFFATKSQYELRFRKWGFRKNITQGDWKSIVDAFERREGENKTSIVEVRGKKILPSRVRKEKSRYGASWDSQKLRGCAVEAIENPSIVRIYSPTPEQTFLRCWTNSYLCYRLNALLELPGFLTTPHIMQPELVRILSEESVPVSSDSLQLSILPNPAMSFQWTASGTAFFDYAKTLNSQTQASLFLRLVVYLISNNHLSGSSYGSPKDGNAMYRWMREHAQRFPLKRLLSCAELAAEALAENLIRLAANVADGPLIFQLIEYDPDLLKRAYVWGVKHQTLLQRICDLRHYDLADSLVRQNRHLDIQSETGYTLLELALESFMNCQRDEDAGALVPVIRMLVGMNATSRMDLLSAALRSAAFHGDFELVEPLLQSGVDVNRSGDVRSHNACGRCDGLDQHPNVLLACLQTGRLKSVDDIMSIVQICLEAGTPVGNEGKEMAAAAALGCLELVQTLDTHGARSTHRSLGNAIQSGDAETVAFFLRKGCEIESSHVERAFEHPQALMLLHALCRAESPHQALLHSAAWATAMESGSVDLVRGLVSRQVPLLPCHTAIEKAAKEGYREILTMIFSEQYQYRCSAATIIDERVIIAALKCGHVDTALLILHQLPDPSILGPPAIYCALKHDSAEVARHLIRIGARLHSFYNQYSPNETYLSVLPLIIDTRDHDLVKETIEAGADIEALAYSGPRPPGLSSGITDSRNALIAAIQTKDRKMLELVLSFRPDLDTPEPRRHGRSALQTAIQVGDLPLIQYLLAIGLSAKDELALEEAVRIGRIDLVQLLLAHHPPAQRHRTWGVMALFTAIEVQNKEILRFLLQRGLDQHTWYAYASHRKLRGLHPITVLFPAISFDTWGEITNRDHLAYFSAHKVPTQKTDMTSILIDEGYDLNMPLALLSNGTHNTTAILTAIEAGNVAIVKLLINAGADTNTKAIRGYRYSPLQLAAKSGLLEIVELLIEKGADVNAPAARMRGATALQFAAMEGFTVIASLLLDHHAEIDFPGAFIDGRTAIEGAAEHGRFDTLRLLLRRGASLIGAGEVQYQNAVKYASNCGYETCRKLLEEHHDIQLKSKDHGPPSAQLVINPTTTGTDFYSSGQSDTQDPCMARLGEPAGDERLSFDIPIVSEPRCSMPILQEDMTFDPLPDVDTSGSFLDNDFHTFLESQQVPDLFSDVSQDVRYSEPIDDETWEREFRNCCEEQDSLMQGF